MAKVSIKQFFARQHKIRLYSFGALAILLVSFSLVLVSQGTKKTLAQVVYSGDGKTCTIKYVTGHDDMGGIPADCERKNIVIDGVDAPEGKAIVYADAVKVKHNVTGAITECYNHPDEVDDYTDTQDSSCDTQRHFDSLELKNGAILTHSAINRSDMEATGGSGNVYAKSISQTTGTGRWKKVDFVVSGTIAIYGSSRIDVDGKGYPGGDKQVPQEGAQPHPDGYGLGGGQPPVVVPGYNFNPNAMFASGGGHGGKGGSTTYKDDYPYKVSDYMKAVGGGTYDLVSPPVDFGSGGGSASYAPGWDCIGSAYGGAGGGKIFLSANRLSVSANSFISADGAAGNGGSCGDSQSSGGGGAGGTISINLTGTLTSGAVLAGAGVVDDSPANAGAGSVTISNVIRQELSSQVGNPKTIAGTDNDVLGKNTVPTAAANITANGGSSAFTREYDAPGGGGIIVINGKPAGLSIKKTLEPVSRNGVPAATTPFNPYSLQMGDVIIVKIEISNMTGTLDTLTDEYLVTKGANAHICRGVNGSEFGAAATFPALSSQVTFSDIPQNATTHKATVSYQCRVE
ncbi:MAG: hypothetical protein WCG48_01055 [Candidatus Berkelbacteria bacterium]